MKEDKTVPIWLRQNQVKREINPLLDCALKYANRGWRVLPLHVLKDNGVCSCGDLKCSTPGKHPRTDHGVKDATCDLPTIRNWWNVWPDANIGVATGKQSGLLVIDFDPRNGSDQSLIELDARGCEFSDTAIVQTGGGGKHYYYQWPHGVDRTAAKLAPGIDVQGEGKYVVAPLSIHATGNAYEWFDDADEEEGANVAPAPTWLIERIQRQALSVNDVESVSGSFQKVEIPLSDDQVAKLDSALQFIDPTRRDDWLAVGMALHQIGAGKQGYMLWCEWSQGTREDNYCERDQLRTWRSFRHDKDIEVTLGTVYRLAGDAGWIDTTQATVIPASAETVSEPEPPPERPAVVPATAYEPMPGILGQFEQWYLKAAPAPVVEFAQMAAVALGSVVCSRHYCTDLNNYTSLFCIALGESGSGKEFIKKAVNDVLKAADAQSLIGPERYASGPAVLSALEIAPSHLSIMDEFGRAIEQIKSKAGGHERDAMTTLMSAWGQLDSVMRSKAYSTASLQKKHREEVQPILIERPAPTIVGQTTPERLWDNLGDGEEQDGFLSRWLIIQSDAKRTLPRPGRKPKPPQAVVDWVKVIRMDSDPVRATFRDDSEAPPDPVVVPLSAEAYKVFEEYAQQCWTLHDELKINGQAELANRWAEMSLRIGLIFALAENPKAKSVESDNMKKAVRFVQKCAQSVLDHRHKIGRSEFARDIESIVDYLQGHARPVAWKELIQNVRCVRNADAMRRRGLKEAIADDANVALVELNKGRQGRPGFAYQYLPDGSLVDKGGQ